MSSKKICVCPDRVEALVTEREMPRAVRSRLKGQASADLQHSRLEMIVRGVMRELSYMQTYRNRAFQCSRL